jgi:hypothetical protein
MYIIIFIGVMALIPSGLWLLINIEDAIGDICEWLHYKP